MNSNLFNPLPIVRPADELAELAARINNEHEAGEGATRQGLEHFRVAGEALIKAKKKCGRGNWLKWFNSHIKFSIMTASRYMRVANNWDKLNTVLNLREALRVLTEDTEDEKEPPIPEYILLGTWDEMTPDERSRVLAYAGDTKFNSQGDNENIEWALWSWNPVTGCLHNCPYCYARDIAHRFYEQKFEPSLWPGRLKAPQNTPFPAEKAVEWMGHKNVFTCSMADLFGRWVPTEWIEAVLNEVRAAPQWNFLFLTKFPIRMAEFDFPENAWVGTTVDCQARVANAEKAFRKVNARVKWLSCEPLIEPLKFKDIGAFSWVVIGGSSSSSQTPEWRPPLAWLANLEQQAAAHGLPCYLKSNLRRREYPGQKVDRPMKAPDELCYLPSVEGEK